MAEKSYHLKVFSGDTVFFDGPVVSTILPGEVGYLGVLANHAPLITTLAPGKLTFRNAEGKEYRYQVGRGFFEVLENNATLMTEALTEVHG